MIYLVKNIKKINIGKNIIFEDECFNVHNLINSVISYVDENIEEMKIINKKDIANINKYKFDKISNIFLKKIMNMKWEENLIIFL